MLRYVSRRLLFMVLSLFGISLVMFVIMYLVPGDPAKAAAGYYAHREQVERIREDMGLDKPVHIQYLTYVWNALHGDLGMSIISRRAVASEMKSYLPASLELGAMATLFTLLVGVPVNASAR